jgi:hypothetical protein
MCRASGGRGQDSCPEEAEVGDAADDHSAAGMAGVDAAKPVGHWAGEPSMFSMVHPLTAIAS